MPLKPITANTHGEKKIYLLKPRGFCAGVVRAIDVVKIALNLYGPPRDWGNIITFIGRLKPGVPLAQARLDAAAVAPRLCNNAKVPQSCGDYEAVPVTLKSYVRAS